MRCLLPINAAHYAVFKGYNHRIDYIYEKPGWPNFTYRLEDLAELLSSVRYRQGMLIGRMEALGFGSRQEATLDALVQEVRKSSEIEGVSLEESQVRSSVARRLGMDVGGLPDAERDVEGVVAMVLDATQNYTAPLTDQRIFGWHSALFPTGWSGMERIAIGTWRDDAKGPMQVVSGPIGRRTVHYQAPSAKRVDAEMRAFLNWFQTQDDSNQILRAGIAHLWFVTIHPLDDGNGRIARAITDLALARADNRDWRCYSMSAQIRQERNDYYDILEKTQKGGLDITQFLYWFLACLDRAMEAAEWTLAISLRRARFWQTHAGTSFNARQTKMLGLMLAQSLDTDLTNAKWAKVTGTSSDSALRDLNDLIEKGILRREGDTGRGARYFLTEPTS